MKKIENKYKLVVSDNGVGISQELNIGETKSLGLRLVSSLTDQIGGTIEIEKSSGTKFAIYFLDKQ